MPNRIVMAAHAVERNADVAAMGMATGFLWMEVITDFGAVITMVLTVVLGLLRIWESPTVKRWTGRSKQK